MKVTATEQRLMELLLKGLTSREIAERLGVAETEVCTVLEKLLRKIRARART